MSKPEINLRAVKVSSLPVPQDGEWHVVNMTRLEGLPTMVRIDGELTGILPDEPES